MIKKANPIFADIARDRSLLIHQIKRAHDAQQVHDKDYGKRQLRLSTMVIAYNAVTKMKHGIKYN